MHTILLKSHDSNTPAPVCLGPVSLQIYSSRCVVNIATVIKLCVFIGTNCNNLIVMHGMQHVKFVIRFQFLKLQTRATP